MKSIKIKIVRLPHGAGLPLPTYQSAAAAGLDLMAAVPAEAPVVIAPGASTTGASTGTAAMRSRPAASAL